MLAKNMKSQDQIELENKMGFEIEKKIKYLDISMTNMNFMLFQNNYIKIGTKLKSREEGEKHNCHCW